MLRSDHGAVNSSGKRLDMPSVFLQLLIALSVNSVFTDSLKLLNIKGHVILIVKTGILFFIFAGLIRPPPPSPYPSYSPDVNMSNQGRCGGFMSTYDSDVKFCMNGRSK